MQKIHVHRHEIFTQVPQRASCLYFRGHCSAGLLSRRVAKTLPQGAASSRTSGEPGQDGDTTHSDGRPGTRGSRTNLGTGQCHAQKRASSTSLGSRPWRGPDSTVLSHVRRLYVLSWSVATRIPQGRRAHSPTPILQVNEPSLKAAVKLAKIHTHFCLQTSALRC